MQVSKHLRNFSDFTKGLIDDMGNDDLIYTPDVVVFKTDERTDPVSPQKANAVRLFFMEQNADFQQVSVFSFVKIANCSRFLEKTKPLRFSESVRAFCVHLWF